MRLGLNIDHIAFLRETRKINDPDPLEAVYIAKRSGVSQITVHLREDRRHINEYDLGRIIDSSFLPVNVESSISKEVIDLICDFHPRRVTLVPEKREEITTEGGLVLDDRLKQTINRLRDNDIEVSLFIDPTIENIDKSMMLGVKEVELHTGRYANLWLMLNSNLLKIYQHKDKKPDIDRSKLSDDIKNELNEIQKVSKYAKQNNFSVYAGHGLNYSNIKPIVDIMEIEELNIGQSIVARAIFSGLEVAIRDMVGLISRLALI